MQIKYILCMYELLNKYLKHFIKKKGEFFKGQVNM